MRTLHWEALVDSLYFFFIYSLFIFVFHFLAICIFLLYLLIFFFFRGHTFQSIYFLSRFILLFYFYQLFINVYFFLFSKDTHGKGFNFFFIFYVLFCHFPLSFITISLLFSLLILFITSFSICIRKVFIRFLYFHKFSSLYFCFLIFISSFIHPSITLLFSSFLLLFISSSYFFFPTFSFLIIFLFYILLFGFF